MSQTKQILALLKKGDTITPYRAFADFGCLAMHSRASELRDMGYDVRCRIVSKNGRRWGEYKLVKG